MKIRVAILFVVIASVGLIVFLQWKSSVDRIEQVSTEIKNADRGIAKLVLAIGEVEKYKGLEGELNRVLEILTKESSPSPVLAMEKNLRDYRNQIWLNTWWQFDRTHLKGGAKDEETLREAFKRDKKSKDAYRHHKKYEVLKDPTGRWVNWSMVWDF